MILPYESGKVELTSKFGWRTLNGAANNHKGIDLVGRTTKTVVLKNSYAKIILM